MENELRLATLSKLLDNPSDAVKKRLDEELRRAQSTLDQDTDYDALLGALKTLAVLAPNFHGAVLPILINFVRSVQARVLTQDGEPIGTEWRRYRSASQLIREAIDVPNAVNYAHVEEMVDFLLELSLSSESEVRDKAESALEKFAQFNLHHFNTLGAGPQTAIVSRFARFDDGQLVVNAMAVLRVLRAVLSSSMEGHAWTYNTLNITRGAIQSVGGVAEMRADAIALLKRMYLLQDTVAYRKSVLSALNSATRRERQYPEGNSANMFERDALEVLDFMRVLVATEALPLIQTIEHDCYWDFVHAASPSIETAALAVRDALAQRSEYQIYKQLIGFEGIIGQWEKLRDHEEERDFSDTGQLEVAQRYVESINADNRVEWRDRILEFSKTESGDLATFPVFYEFLERLGRHIPDLALELVQNHEERMRPFLIPLISGLRASERKLDIQKVTMGWLGDGTHLIAIAKSLLNGGIEWLDTLSAVVTRAAQFDDREAISTAMGVAARLHSQGGATAKAVFLQGLRALALQNDSRWARVFWFGRDFKVLVADMDAAERAEVLASLALLRELDYQAEEMLYAIGEQDIDAVFGFLSGRLSAEAEDRAHRRAEGGNTLDDKFEAIPHQLHRLNKLFEKHPEAVISLLRRHFGDKDDRLMFPYRSGASLMKSVFPNFETRLQANMLKLVETGDDSAIEFVLAVVRSYGGNAPILDVCKAIVKVVPEHSNAWRELAAAIESTATVRGEYGLVEAFERKRDDLAAWTSDENTRVQAFANWLMEDLEHMIASERQRVAEDVALRKYHYGVGGAEA